MCGSNDVAVNVIDNRVANAIDTYPATNGPKQSYDTLPLPRVFRLGDRIYVVAKGKRPLFINKDGFTADSAFKTEELLLQHPDTIEVGGERKDRLKAAEEDTGFSLGQIVQERYGDERYGKVIGFARVNIENRESVRVVVVSFGQEDYNTGTNIPPGYIKSA